MISKLQRRWSASPAGFSLLLILVAYVAFFVVYNLQQHASFQTAGFDLGIYDQVMWNTLHGKPLAMTTRLHVASRWGVHFEPILFLIVPIYALFSFPHTLLILQTVVVALGAIPIFLLARKVLISDLAGLVFALIYLLFPALQGAIIFDFHAVALATTFFSLALWFLASQQYRLLFLMVLLAMACKEDISLPVVIMGGYLCLAQKQYQWGGLIIGLAGLLFVLANFVIIPSSSATGENVQLDRYSQWGDSMGQVIGNLLLRPLDILNFMFSGDRLRYWLRATIPVVFTAFLDPLTMLMAIPTMAINTLSTYPPTYQLDRFHYSALIIPFVTVASINGLARLIRFAASRFKYVELGFLQNSLLAVMLLVTLIYQIQFGHTPIGRYFNWPSVTKHHRQAEAMLARIPPQAAVTAQNNLVPRLSQREWIFILPKVSHGTRQADYIALDMQSSLVPYRYIEEYCAHLNEFVTNPDYGLIFADDGLLLFKRGVPDTATFEPQPPCL